VSEPAATETARAKYQIGEVAEAVGLSLRTIRYYGEEGLVVPSRTTGGFRLYTDGDIERFRLIMEMKPLDFTLDEMREVLTIRDRLDVATGEDERRQLLERLAMFAAAGEQRCERLREQLGIAEAFTDDLRREVTRQQR
jgi:DNA-binding transcriptional MerR regulator